MCRLGSRRYSRFGNLRYKSSRSLRNIPVHRGGEAVWQVHVRRVAEQLVNPRNVGHGMPHVARAEVPVLWLDTFQARKAVCEPFANTPEQFVQRGLFTERNIVNLVGGFGRFGGCRENIRLHDVRDMAKITRDRKSTRLNS